MAIAAADRARPFSLHYELRALLYLGITLLAGELGGGSPTSNIDGIGHGVIIAVIAGLMAACLSQAASSSAAGKQVAAGPPASSNQTATGLYSLARVATA